MPGAQPEFEGFERSRGQPVDREPEKEQDSGQSPKGSKKTHGWDVEGKVGGLGLEPRTNGLKGHCSTN